VKKVEVPIEKEVVKVIKEIKYVPKKVSNPVEEIKEVVNMTTVDNITVKFVEVDNVVKVNQE
jgi:hypothetical protein